MKIMETANAYLDTDHQQYHFLSNTATNKSSPSFQQLHNSMNQQCYNQINQQLNQLTYIDDDYGQSTTTTTTNPPYYADLKVNDDLQRLQIDDNPPPEQLKHWSKLVYECMEIQLFEWNIAGGSDYGQLTYFIDSADIILEIDGFKISGFTRNDVLSLIRSKQYHFIKAVPSSSSFDLPIDLKDYLSRRFVRGSVDHELQSTIRDNVYVRTVPCTTRLPKPNEVDGVDYKFVSKEEFLEMERSGVLLESGIYCGHYYGTPLPLSNPISNYLKLTDTVDNKLTASMINDRFSGTNLISNSLLNNSTMSNSTAMSKELLSPSADLELASSKNSDPLQQSPAQLSAMALKRRRNRSNIVAIDASALPKGWERILDPVHGIYYIDHINKRTQYERPYEVELTKGANGFGFTLSYLNSGLVVVKTIPLGPASQSGIIQPADILVSVSNVSVSGLSHADIAKLFSTFEIGDRVKLTFARSLQVPSELQLDLQQLQQKQAPPPQLQQKQQQHNHNPVELAEQNEEYDLITVDISKGANGFGFTISDATNGQKVKKILDTKRCGALAQGDLLASVNGIDLSNLNHIEVVEVLKNHCHINEETRFTVKRFKRLQQQQQSEGEEDKEINVASRKTPNYLDDANDKPQYNNTNGDSVPKEQGVFNHPNYSNENYEPYDCDPNAQDTAQPQSNNKLNDNLIAELKANLALNSSSSTLMRNNNNSVNNEMIMMNSPIMINNYSNIDTIDQSDLNGGNVYSVIENNNQSNFLNSTMMGMDQQSANEDEFEYFRVFLNRNATNYSFGFRIVGGCEENRPVTIGSIVIGGVAHVDGILKAGDEIISINDQNVMNCSHHYVVKLMSECGVSVSLLVRRRKDSDAFDVVLNRDPITDTFGFGFVIISCGNCALIGRIIDNSPASRCGRLKIRDKIIAVNNVNITQMNHPDIVNMIKESGLTLKLRIIPADCYLVELIRGAKGFGFSIRGGMEFNGMQIFILRIAPDGPAYSLLNIGDEIIEINHISTAGMTHSEAVLLISQSGPSVKLKLRRRDIMSTSTSMTNFNAALQQNSAESYVYYD